MIRLRSECMHCLVNTLWDLPDTIPEAEKLVFLQKVFKILSDAPLTTSAPVIVCEINQLKAEMFNITEDYSDIKTHFNQVMTGFQPSVEQKLAAAADPLKLALQYSMVGNYIDFGAMKNVDEDQLTRLLDDAENVQVDSEQYALLREDLRRSKSFVMLTDNCGEIVMDKLLVQVIREMYPQLDITVIVRGGPVINDATLEDAEQVGLTAIARVIGNGSNIAGTCLELLSDESSEIIHHADVILSKGQGNFETMRKCRLNVYYAFLCKCDMFAKQFNVERLTGILINDRFYK